MPRILATERFRQGGQEFEAKQGHTEGQQSKTGWGLANKMSQGVKMPPGLRT